MHNRAGACLYGKHRGVGNDTAKEDQARQKIQETVLVGKFLTRYKLLDDLKPKDIPDKSEFELWAAGRKLDVASIDYLETVDLILKNL